MLELIDQNLQLSISADNKKIREIFSKALELKGLSVADVSALVTIEDPLLLQELFQTAEQIKSAIYGNRLVFFAPLYLTNRCINECVYCGFRRNNHQLKRCTLNKEQLITETEMLINQGHKRVLLVAGETPFGQATLDAIETIYRVKTKSGTIRRINVNVAPLTVEQFKQLKDAEIGTYQLFQETYHKATYQQVHVAGPKSDYDWRITAIDRAMEAGIDDVGIGALFGLYDWRFELLALLKHAEHLEKKFGVGPHTISVPRLEPAFGSDFKANYLLSDRDFSKLIAILRLAVPYTGLILSTRETPDTRRQALKLGVSQISAGSRTNPGGYSASAEESEQFSLGDHRSLDEVVYDVVSLGYLPSFCTGCYRRGRTGERFMELAKPGDIKKICEPNGLVTFLEYLLDCASEKTRLLGEDFIQKRLNEMPPATRQKTESFLARIRSGERDVYI